MSSTLAEVVASTTQQQLDARRRGSTSGVLLLRSQQRRKSLSNTDDENADIYDFLSNFSRTDSSKKAVLRSALLYHDDDHQQPQISAPHSNNNNGGDDNTNNSHSATPAASLFLITKNNNKNNNNSNNFMQNQNQQQQQHRVTFGVPNFVDKDGFSKALLSEMEALRDTSDLVFTKKKQLEEALAEKRRRNGLIVAKVIRKAASSSSLTSAPSPSRGLFTNGLIGAASGTNLNALRRENTQRNQPCVVTSMSSFSKKDKSKIASFRKNGNGNDDDDDHDDVQDGKASMVKVPNNNDSNNAINTNNCTLRTPTFFSGAAGSLASFQSELGATLLNSEEGEASSCHSMTSDDDEQGEQTKPDSFKFQMNEPAKKFDDFFWNHTVAEKISFKSILRTLVRRANLKRSARKLVELFLFSQKSVSRSKIVPVHEFPSSTATATAATAGNNNTTDPDIELLSNFQSKNQRRDQNERSAAIRASPSSPFDQQHPSFSLVPAMESCLRLLDTVVYKLDKSWTDVPPIATEIILPLNQFWRDLQKFSSDLMTKPAGTVFDTFDVEEDQRDDGERNKRTFTSLNFMPERERVRMNHHRERVRTAREVATILVCLSVVLQHRRLYVAKEWAKVKRSQEAMKEKNKSTNEENSDEGRDGGGGGSGGGDREFAIPKYKPNMHLGVSFLISTSAGVLMGEGVARLQLEALFPAIALEGICVDEVDEEKMTKKNKSWGEGGLRKRRNSELRLHHENTAEKEVGDDDGDDDVVDDYDFEKDGNDEYAERGTVHETEFQSSRASSSPSQQPVVTRAFANNLPQLIAARVGIGSHTQTTLIPLQFLPKSRQQLEAERAGFLLERRKFDSHIRVIERAFDKYLLQSRQVEVTTMLTLSSITTAERDDGDRHQIRDQQQRHSPLSSSPLPLPPIARAPHLDGAACAEVSHHEAIREKKKGAKTKSSTPSAAQRLLLTASTSQARSIFDLARLTDNFPREPRRHFALTKKTTTKKQVKKAHRIGASALLVVDAVDGDDELEEDEDDQASTPLITTTTTMITMKLDKVNHMKMKPELPLLKDNVGQTIDSDCFLTSAASASLQHRDKERFGVVLTPSPQKGNRGGLFAGEVDRATCPCSFVESAKTPNPKLMTTGTTKNDNRIYDSRKSRALWGVSPSFEMASSSVTRSLQLKPML